MRFRYLDLLRGIAALAVMFYHSTHSAVFSGLYIFVDLFFVLSGFVLEPQLTAASAGSRWLFVKRRIVRIWPLTILSLAFVLITWLVQHWLKTNVTGLEDLKIAGRDPIWLIPAALLLQVFVTQCINWLTPLWSLSAE